MDAVTVSAHLTNPIQLSAAEGEKQIYPELWGSEEGFTVSRETNENVRSAPPVGLISQYISAVVLPRSNLSDKRIDGPSRDHKQTSLLGLLLFLEEKWYKRKGKMDKQMFAVVQSSGICESVIIAN